MTRKITWMLAATVLAGLLTACGGGSDDGNAANTAAQTPPPTAGMVGDGRLGQILEWARATQNLPAMALVMVKDGQIAEMAVVGHRTMSRAVPVTTSDRWHIGSLTKAMTATLAGVLVEQSVIGWDTRPIDVWPELGNAMHPGFRDITLRQLLSHTSGMRRVNDVPPAFHDDMPGTLVEKRRQWVEQLLAEPPEGPVGQFSYSNGAFVVAGAMLETVTSTQWETLLEQHVFAPLGMFETGFGAPGTPGEMDQPWGHWDLGGTYDPVPPGPDADNPQAIGPAGTVHTTLNDYALFMMAHIDGARGVPGIVTVPTFEMLHTAVADGYALGWGVGTESWARGLVLGHAGSNVRWWAAVRLAPERNAGVFLVINAAGRAEIAADLIGDLLVERFEATP